MTRPGSGLKRACGLRRRSDVTEHGPSQLAGDSPRPRILVVTSRQGAMLEQPGLRTFAMTLRRLVCSASVSLLEFQLHPASCISQDTETAAPAFLKAH